MEQVQIVKITRSKTLNTDSTCIECGSIFKVSFDEIKRFQEKKIPVPTRCRSCRRYKLIEIKLKKITKLCSMIFQKLGESNHYEPKLQTKPIKGEPTEKLAWKRRLLYDQSSRKQGERWHHRHQTSQLWKRLSLRSPVYSDKGFGKSPKYSRIV